MVLGPRISTPDTSSSRKGPLTMDHSPARINNTNGSADGQATATAPKSNNASKTSTSTSSRVKRVSDATIRRLSIPLSLMSGNNKQHQQKNNNQAVPPSPSPSSPRRERNRLSKPPSAANSVRANSARTSTSSRRPSRTNSSAVPPQPVSATSTTQRRSPSPARASKASSVSTTKKRRLQRDPPAAAATNSYKNKNDKKRLHRYTWSTPNGIGELPRFDVAQRGYLASLVSLFSDGNQLASSNMNTPVSAITDQTSLGSPSLLGPHEYAIDSPAVYAFNKARRLYVGRPGAVHPPPEALLEFEMETLPLLERDLHGIAGHLGQQGIRITYELRMSGYAMGAMAESVVLAPTVWILYRCYSSVGTMVSIAELHQAVSSIFYLKRGIEIQEGGGRIELSSDRAVVHNLKVDPKEAITLSNGANLSVHVEDCHDKPSVCGALCCVTIEEESRTTQSLCRIGGLLKINGKYILGVSTAHGMLDSSGIFRDSFDENPADHARTPQGKAADRDAILSQTQRVDKWHNVTRDAAVDFLGISMNSRGEMAINRSKPENATDFALLRLRKMPGRVRNKYTPPGSAGDGETATVEPVSITSTASASAASMDEGPVYIVCGGGDPIEGQLVWGSACFIIRGRNFRVRRIQTSTPLSAGITGAWVVRGEVLYGTVVAVYDNEPYVLMMTAERLSASILGSAFSIRSVDLWNGELPDAIKAHVRSAEEQAKENGEGSSRAAAVAAAVVVGDDELDAEMKKKSVDVPRNEVEKDDDDDDDDDDEAVIEQTETTPNKGKRVRAHTISAGTQTEGPCPPLAEGKGTQTEEPCPPRPATTEGSTHTTIVAPSAASSPKIARSERMASPVATTKTAHPTRPRPRSRTISKASEAGTTMSGAISAEEEDDDGEHPAPPTTSGADGVGSSTVPSSAAGKDYVTPVTVIEQEDHVSPKTPTTKSPTGTKPKSPVQIQPKREKALLDGNGNGNINGFHRQDSGHAVTTTITATSRSSDPKPAINSNSNNHSRRSSLQYVLDKTFRRTSSRGGAASFKESGPYQGNGFGGGGGGTGKPPLFGSRRGRTASSAKHSSNDSGLATPRNHGGSGDLDEQQRSSMFKRWSMPRTPDVVSEKKNNYGIPPGGL